MTDAFVQRRRVAVRLLLLEAGFLTGIFGGFALLAWWLEGATGSEVSLIAGLALLPLCLLANWFLVRSQWKRLGDDFGGGPRAP